MASNRSTSKNCDLLELKVVLIGESDVGKTSIMVRYLRDRFDAFTPSQGKAG